MLQLSSRLFLSANFENRSKFSHLYLRLFLVLFVLLVKSSSAQVLTTWRGAIRDDESKRPLQGVVITNLNSQKVVFSDAQGHFDIEGREGDKVGFACPGYRSEQHLIIMGLEGIRLNFGMKMVSRELKEVVITQKYKTAYQRDSAERRSEQARILSRTKSSVMSPVSFVAERLSKRQKAIFRFQKNFYKGEQQIFIDSRYTPELVSSLTNLNGDTLAYFMNTYPMEYEYARAATPLELKMWIKFNYKDFLHKTDSLRLLQLPLE